jgi:hypothetical protein
MQLKDRRQRVELRVVLHSITAPRIEETARWLSRNLPFVDHVALMGLETTGFAIGNDALLWIDPIDYRDALARAVDHLRAANVNVSIFRAAFSTEVFGMSRRSRSPTGKMLISPSAKSVPSVPGARDFSPPDAPNGAEQ